MLMASLFRGESISANSVYCIMYVSLFIVIAAYDIKYRIIPNRLLLIMSLIRLSQMAICLRRDFNYAYTTIETILLCLCISVISITFWMVCQRRNILLGSGDCKYLITLSFCLEKQVFISAIIVCTMLLLLKRYMKRTQTEPSLPFAKYASSGAVIAYMLSFFTK